VAGGTAAAVHAAGRDIGEGGCAVDAIEVVILLSLASIVIVRREWGGGRGRGHGHTAELVPWTFVSPASMALSDWGMPLSYSAPRGMMIVRY
jgi:hypothetical protein